MPHQPVQLDFVAVPLPAGVEAAARRRMRRMENCYPAIQEWQLRVTGPEGAAHAEACFRATVAARIVGGERLRGQAQGADAFAALRVAFNGLEQELEADYDDVRHRVSAWLTTVRRRLAAHRGED